MAEFRVLGRIGVEVGGEPKSLGGARQRRLLGVLLLHRNRTVSLDRISEAVWPSSQPGAPVETLRTYVARLRKSLAEIDPNLADSLATAENGYCFNPDLPVDADTFEEGFERSKQLVQLENPAGALHAIDDAIRCWDGRAFDEFADEEWAQGEAVRLDTLYIDAKQLRIDCLLATDDADTNRDALASLEGLIIEYPLREAFRRQKMIALHRTGRKTEALRAYQEYRSYLRDESGLEPSEDLANLEDRILQDREVTEAAGGTVRGYVLDDFLGEGIFGQTHLARQPHLNRVVALKEIRRITADERAFVQSFDLRASEIAAIDHPNVVPVVDAWREPGAAFLVSKHMSGNLEALSETITNDPERFKQLVCDVLLGLDACHRAGISHRNIHARNVLLSEDGSAAIADLLLAPETDPNGAAGDVYQAALLFVEMLIGESEHSYLETSAQAENAMEQHGSEIDASFRAVLARAVSANPVDRFTTASDFLAALATTTETGQANTATPRDLAPTNRLLANPFKGLRPFSERDSDEFFGRAEAIEGILKMLRNRRFVAVVGPSGSGKSSVVRAGVVPELHANGVFIAPIVPGPHPFDELETALLRLAPAGTTGLLAQLQADERGLSRVIRRLFPEDAEVLLVVDQFEELFTLCDAETRSEFLAALRHLVETGRSRVRAVVTIRADFFDRPLSSPEIGRLVKDSTYALTPMDVDELMLAINAPLERVGVEIAPAVTSTLVADVRGGASSLPLLQYALTQLFDRRSDNQIGVEQLESIGGITGALSGRADEILDTLSPDEITGVRRLFTRLVTPGEGTEDTRSRVPISQLPSVDPEIISLFGEARLLSFDHDPVTREPTIEVAHEALIREWPTLRLWIDDDREALRQTRHVGTAARSWDAASRDDSELYRGGRLDSALELLHDDNEWFNEVETAFVERSEQVRRSERDREQAQLGKLRRRLVGAGVLLLLSMLAGLLALQQRDRADDEANRAVQAGRDAETRRLVADAGQVVESNKRIGLLLAAEAARRDPSPETLGALQRVLVGSEQLLGYFGGEMVFNDVTFLDQETIAASHDAGVAIIDLSTGREQRSLDVPGAESATASPDGLTLAVVTSDSSVKLFDTSTGNPSPFQIRNNADVTSLAFSPDSSGLAIGDRAGFVRIFDLRDGEELRAFSAHPEQGLENTELIPEGVALEVPHEPETFLAGVTEVAISNDGQNLATIGGVTVRVWDFETGEMLSSGTVVRAAVVGGTVVSPPAAIRWISDDEVVLVTAFELQRWRVGETTSHFSSVLPDREGGISLERSSASADLSASRGVIGSPDGRLAVFDLSGDKVVDTFDTQFAGRLEVALSPDENAVAVAGTDGIGLFSLDGSRIIADALPSILGEITLNPDASVVSVSNVEDIEPEIWRRDPNGSYTRASPLGDGAQFGWASAETILVTWNLDETTITVRDSDTMRPRFTLSSQTVFSTATDPAETMIALGSTDTIENPANVSVLDVETGEQLALLDDLREVAARSDIRTLNFSNDGTRLVGSTITGAAVVWDTATWEVVGPVLSQGGGSVVQAAFSNDDEWLVTISEGGLISFRDPVTYQPDGPTLLGNTDAVAGFSYGPFFDQAGRHMITTADGLGRIWDIENEIQVGSPFPSDARTIPHVSADGQTLATFLDGHVLLWDLDTTTWLDTVCRAAGRNMTQAEWDQFGPTGEPYVETCPQWSNEGEQENE